MFVLQIFCLFGLFFGSLSAQNNSLKYNDASKQEILTYWFGHLESAEDYPKEKSKIWFNGGERVDQEIRERFGHLLEKAKNHELDHWKKKPRGRLALIILVDQFSRNIYRGTPVHSPLTLLLRS